MSELRRVAYHEAGHAVTSVLRGFPLWYVTIRPSDGYAGKAQWFARWKHQTFSELDFMTVMEAGAAAERRYQNTGLVEQHAVSDRRAIEAIKALIPEPHREGQHMAAQFLAARDVERHWRWVSLVAEELIRQKEITVSRVRELRPEEGPR